MPSVPRSLSVPAAVAAGTLVLFAVFGGGAVGVASQYDLLWGAQLAAGDRLELDAPFAPTQHPLTTVLGAAIALAGGGVGAMAVLQLVALAAMGAAVWLLAAELFDRWVASLAVVLLALTPFVIPVAFEGVKTSLWIGGLSLAGWLELRRPRAGLPVLGLLALLGLLRPEAWVLSGLYVGFLWAAPEGRRPLGALVAASGPLAWAAFDWWQAGTPLAALHGTTDLRAALERETGLPAALAAVPRLVHESLGPTLAVAGVLGAVLAFAGARRRAVVALAVVAAAITGSFLVQSALGFSVIAAYLLPVSVALVILAAAAVLAPRQPHAGVPRAVLGAIGAVTATALVLGVPERLEHQQRMRADVRALATAWTDLATVITRSRADAACGPVDLAGPYAPRPLLALHLGRRAGSLADATVAAPRPGLHVVATEPAMRAALADLPFARRDAAPPTGGRRLWRNASWTAWEACA